jgi:luciferase family oxidoreductase group 1
LPNHSPLVVAEQFGTLAALHPSRIDLGIGRATGGPGADSDIFRMLRKPPDARDKFEVDLDELLALLDEQQRDDAPRVPARGLKVPVWLLGSSTSSAALAGKLGLPFSYATHIAPDDLQAALRAHRTTFRASRALQRRYAMISAFIIAAETDAQAEDLLASMRPILLRWFRKTSAPLPTDNVAAPAAASTLTQDRPYVIVGAPNTGAVRYRGYGTENAGRRADGHHADPRPRCGPPLLSDRCSRLQGYQPVSLRESRRWLSM